MTSFYVEPSTLIWDLQHFSANPHQYDDVIGSIIELLACESCGECELVFLKAFINSILDYFPYTEIDNGHWPNKSDFTNQVFSSISKWMSDGKTVDDIEMDALLDIVECEPILLSERSGNLMQLSKQSNSFLYNKVDIPALAFTPFKHNAIVLTKYDANGRELNRECRQLFFDFSGCYTYINNQQLLCRFSPKHHPISGWGTKMPHEELELMQELLDSSIYEEGKGHRIRYAKCNRDYVFYAFRVTNGRIFHPYPVEAEEIPHLIHQKLENV